MDAQYMEYRLNDGRTIGGANFEELVDAMADTKFTAPRSRASYRRATARRVAGEHGSSIDSSTDEKFIQGLIDIQLLWALEDDH